jgi:hypothetical protein
VPFPGAGSLSWGPRPLLIGAGALTAALIGVYAVLSVSPLERLVAGAICLVLLVATLAGYRRRVVAGPGGLLIRRLTGSRTVQWWQVENLSLGANRRLGAASATIEMDLHDDDLLIFGRTELGTDPADVLPELRRWWSVTPRTDWPVSGPERP